VRLKDGFFKKRGPLAADLLLWQGTIEGKFLGALTSRFSLGNIFARVATSLGALITPDNVPDFIRDLATMNPREFFLLCSALETTARQSYERMADLAEIVAKMMANNAARSLQLENLPAELRLKLADETFHEEAFQEMAGWVKDGKVDGSLDERDAAERLYRLLPRAGRAAGDTTSPYVITDGGLGPLFQKQGIVVSVIG
jgi:regulator of replication initiation timing